MFSHYISFIHQNSKQTFTHTQNLGDKQVVFLKNVSKATKKVPTGISCDKIFHKKLFINIAEKYLSYSIDSTII